MLLSELCEARALLDEEHEPLPSKDNDDNSCFDFDIRLSLKDVGPCYSGVRTHKPVVATIRCGS